MEIKEYLSQAFYLDKEIQFKEIELKNLESRLGYKSPTLKEVKYTGTKTEQDLICDIIAHKEFIKKDISNLIFTKQKIVRFIDSIVDTKVRTIFYLRYLELKKWSEIAEAMHYSDRQIYYLHNSGLKYLDNILKLQSIAE